MRDWRLSFWLIAAGIYAFYTGLHLGRWQDLTLWTRAYASIELCTSLSMLLSGVGLLVARSRVWALILIGALAPALLGISLIAGTWLGTIPCTGGS